MYSVVVPHYRPCLLVWYLTIGHACWSVLYFNRYFSLDIALVEGRRKMDGYKSGATLTGANFTSDMFADPVLLSDMHTCTVQLYQTCMLGSFIQIHVFVKCLSISQEIWYVTNSPDMPTG